MGTRQERSDGESIDRPMRVGLGQFTDPDDETLRYVSQLGVEDVVCNFYASDLAAGESIPLSGAAEWATDELVALRERIESFGLRLHAIENFPTYFYDDVMLGREGRDEQLEHLKNTIRNVGEAGIPVIGYNWMPNGVWRNDETVPVRGGAQATQYDADTIADADVFTHGREYTEEEFWNNYEYFLREVIPVAEDAGVTMCVHPDDPPVESLGGVPRLFRDPERYERAMDLVDSDNHGIEFCLGCWSEMGVDVPSVVRRFGERGDIVYVHFRDVRGAVPSFHETFLRDGDFDEYEVVRALLESGFDGVVITDHVPAVAGDTEWGHRARGFTAGYLMGLLTAVKREYPRA